MNRSLKLSVVLALVLGSSQTFAGVGQIHVKSALGQPLLAEIPLQPDSPAELRNLSAALASSEEFARAGISDRPSVPLQFSVVNGADGGKLIRVTSTQAISAPYLDLLIQVTSAAGTSLREFTVLLDPPGMASPPEVATPVAPAAAAIAPPQAPPSSPAQPSPAPAASESPAQTQAPAPAPAPAQPQPQAVTAPVARRPATPVVAARTPRASSDRYGPVKRGDTLSSIARRGVASGGNTEQMLLALKQANPEAFFRDNINALKTGAVLRMPSPEQLAQVSAADAAAEVRRQNQAWRGGPAQVPATTVVADAATRPAASMAPSAKPSAQDRLALVPAKAQSQTASSSAGSPSANAAATAGLAALQQQQAQLQESLSTLQQQGGELRSRVKDLEDINAKNERLLALKDNEIADLQRKLADAQKAGQAVPAGVNAVKGDIPASAPAPSGTNAAASSALSQADNAPTAATSTAAAVGAAASNNAGNPASAASVHSPTPAASVATGAVTPPTPKSAPATVAAEPWFMQPWAWLAGGVAVVLLLLISRRRKAAQVAVPATAASSSLAEHFVDAPATSGEDAPYDTDLHELQDQLAEHPDDIGLRLELISLYYDRRDADHFEAEAEAMYAHISNPQQEEWQDVVAMGRELVPGHPLFAEPGTATAHEDIAHEPPAPFSFDEPHYNLSAVPPLPESSSTLAPSWDEAAPEVWDRSPNAPPLPDADASAPLEPASSTLPESEPSASNGADEPPPLPTDAYIPPRSSQEPLPPNRWQFDEPLLDEPVVRDAAPTPATPSPHELSMEQPALHELSLDEGLPLDHGDAEDGALSHFSDDPVDTKLDLARAYLDMGDADGARSMLDEVLSEGSQMQQDVARKLLTELH
jgi:pilus assembly protein FimV